MPSSQLLGTIPEENIILKSFSYNGSKSCIVDFIYSFFTWSSPIALLFLSRFTHFLISSCDIFSLSLWFSSVTSIFSNSFCNKFCASSLTFGGLFNSLKKSNNDLISIFDLLTCFVFLFSILAEKPPLTPRYDQAKALFLQGSVTYLSSYFRC